MNLERTESPGWLSNAYLIDDGAGTGVLIDGNGVAGPLLEAIDRRGLRVPAILLTHHHVDHVVLDDYRELGAEVYAHPLTAAEPPGVVDTELADGQVLDVADLRRSLERLLALPPTTRVHPGHREPTTIGEEREANEFVRALLGDQVPAGVPCTVGGEPAELLFWGPDYDGTNKAWVRFAADGEEAVVGGSQVTRDE